MIWKPSLPIGALTVATHVRPPPMSALHPVVEARRFIVSGVILPLPDASVITTDCGIAPPVPLAGTLTVNDAVPVPEACGVVVPAEPNDGRAEDPPPRQPGNRKRLAQRKALAIRVRIPLV
jgi:hypothetical protein